MIDGVGIVVQKIVGAFAQFGVAGFSGHLGAVQVGAVVVGRQTGAVVHGVLGGLEVQISALDLLLGGIVGGGHNLGVGQGRLKGLPFVGVAVGSGKGVVLHAVDQLIQLVLGDGLGVVHALDAHVVDHQVAVIAKGGGSTAGALGIGFDIGGHETEPGLAVGLTGDGGLVGLGDELAVLVGQIVQRLGLGGIVIALIAHDYGIGALGTDLVVEAHLVGAAGLETEVLGNGLIQDGVALYQAVGLQRPVAFQHVVALLHVPAALGVGSVQLGQMAAVVGDALHGTHHEGIHALDHVLEVLEVGRHLAVFVVGVGVALAGQAAHVVEVGQAGTGITAEGQGSGLGVGHKEHIHVLEVAAGALLGGDVVAVRIGRNVVVDKGQTGVVAGQHTAVDTGDGHVGIGLAAVVHADVQSVGFTGHQIGDGVADGIAAGQDHHGVGGDGVVDLGAAGVDGPLAGFQAVAVEAGVIQVVALPAADIDLALLALVDHIGNLGLGGKGDLAVHNRNNGLVALALVGQGVHDHIFQVFPSVGQLPFGGTALGVPVVQLLLVGGQVFAGGAPVPGNQVGLVALLVVVRTAHMALQDHLAVEGDGAVTVGRHDVLAVILSVGTGDHYLAVGIVLQGDLLFRGPGLSIGGADGFAVDPLGDQEVLEELGGDVVGEQVVDVIVVVAAALPALEVLHVVAAQQRRIGGAAVVGVVAYPGVLLVVADEAGDGAVVALGGVAAVGQVGGPVLEGGVVLVAGAPFGGHTPAVAGDLVAQTAGSPAVFQGTGQVAPNVHIDPAQVLAHLLLQSVEAGFPAAADQVKQAVDADALIQPVPAVAQSAAGVAAHQQLVKGLGLGVHLAGVDVDAEGSAQLGALGEQLVHVLGAAQTGADVGIVGMAGVMALVGVALQQNRLAQTVGVQVDPLDVVQGLHEGVGSLAAEVHADAHAHSLGYLFAAQQLMGDLPEGNGAVLPIHSAVLVLVAGNDHLDQGVLGGLGDVGLIGLAGGVALVLGLDGTVPIEQSTAQSHHLVAAHFGCGGPDTGIGGTAGHGVGHHAAVVLGVALHGGAHAVGRHKGVHIVGAAGGQVGVHILEGIAGLAGVIRHLAAREGGVFLAAAHRNQAVVGEVNGLDRMLLLAVLLVVDHFGDLHGQHVALHSQNHLDGGIQAGVVLDMQHIGGLAVLQGELHVLGRQLNVGAVDLDGVQGAGAAVEGFAVQFAALHVVFLDSGEFFIHGDRHLVGGDGLGGSGLQSELEALHISVFHGDLLALAAVALQAGGGFVAAVYQIGNREAAVLAGGDGLVPYLDGSALGGLTVGGDSAADRVAGHFLLAFKVDVLDQNVGGSIAPLGSLEGDGTAAAAGQSGQIHRAAEGILAVDSHSSRSLGIVNADLGLHAGGGSCHAASLVPGVALAIICLPEPAAGIAADEQAVADAVAAQINTKSGVGGAADRLEGKLQIAFALVEADIGVGNIELIGAVVAAGGFDMQPSILHRNRTELVAGPGAGVHGIFVDSQGSNAVVRRFLGLLHRGGLLDRSGFLLNRSSLFLGGGGLLLGGGGLTFSGGGFALGGGGLTFSGGGFALGGGGLTFSRGGFALGGGGLTFSRGGFALGGGGFTLGRSAFALSGDLRCLAGAGYCRVCGLFGGVGHRLCHRHQHRCCQGQTQQSPFHVQIHDVRILSFPYCETKNTDCTFLRAGNLQAACTLSLYRTFFLLSI